MCVEELKQQYLQILESESFRREFDQLLRDYVGRPSLKGSANGTQRLEQPDDRNGSRPWSFASFFLSLWFNSFTQRTNPYHENTLDTFTGLQCPLFFDGTGPTFRNRGGPGRLRPQPRSATQHHPLPGRRHGMAGYVPALLDPAYPLQPPV